MRLLWLRPIVALFALMVPVYAQRPGGFQVIGPGGGGAMFHPAISPHDPNTVLVACDMSGSYITHDAGRTWRMFNLRGSVDFFAFDPGRPGVIYANGIGLWRSEDDGVTWRLVYPVPGSIRALKTAVDEADITVLAQPDPMGKLTALAVDPSDSKTLYAAAEKDGNAAVFVSRDDGGSWQKMASLPEAAPHLWVDPASPEGGRRLIVAGAHGFEVVSPAGVEKLTGLPQAEVVDASVGFAHGEAVLYAATTAGVYVSSDGGKSWQHGVLPDENPAARGPHPLGDSYENMIYEMSRQRVAVSADHPDVAYLTYIGHAPGDAVWIGLAKTTDAGKTWKVMWKDADHGAPNLKGGWIEEDLGSGWGGNPEGIAVAANDPSVVYFTDLGRTVQSLDGGQNWQQVFTRRNGSGWTSRGLDVTTAYGVHFDPFDKQRMFITYTDIGLFRSEDGGRSWISSTKGVPREWRNTTYWVVFDPKVKGRMWSANSGTHDIPRTRMWRHRSVLTYKGGVCRSDDGGRTWVKSNDGLPESAVTHLLLDSTRTAHGPVLYAAAFGHGVYKSVDGGRSWQLKSKGIVQKEPLVWRLAEDTRGTLYVLLARRTEDGSIGNAGDGAIYRSTDGAESWQPVAMPEDTNAPNGLAIDPQAPSRMYLAAWARAAGIHGKGGGIYLTEDGGKTWRRVLDRDRHVYSVTVDPRDSKTLYATGFEASAWRSVDRGEHWTRIPGFNFRMAHRVIPDPYHPGEVYIATFGGSVWHGAVNGKPAVLDIATPELEPGR